MRGKASAITQSFTAQLNPVATPAIKPQIRYWFNPGRADLEYFGPGVLAFGLAMFPPLLAALAMSREGELKTILQVYVSSISAHEFLLGKILAGMAVGLVQCLLGVVLMLTVFSLDFVGDPTPF
jgi:ABC-2 type transport system permease protein